MSENQGPTSRFRELSDGIPLGLYRSTPEGRLLDANLAYVEMVGAPNREAFLATETQSLYVDPQDQRRWRERMEKEGEVRGFLTRFRRFDGDTIWVEETARAARDPAGNVVYYEGVVEDITDRVAAQEQLAAAEALLHAAVEQSPAGVIIADASDGTIRMANSAAIGIRGSSALPLTEIPAELHARNWRILRPDGTPCPPEDLPLTRAIRGGESVADEEYIIRRDDGEDRWVLAHAAPVRNPDGKIVAGIAIFPDITERKLARRSLERREAILAAVAYAAGCFLTSPTWEDHMQEVLARLGRAVDVSRTYLFEVHRSDAGPVLACQRFEWVGEGVEAFIGDAVMQDLDMEAEGLGRWLETLEGRGVVSGHLRDFPECEQWLIEAQDIRSIVLVPVFAGERWWGLMGFDACGKERQWDAAETEALRTAARTLGAAILRREAEAERARLAASVDQVADSIVITDSRGDIQYVNSAFERITGYAVEEAIGRNPRFLKSGFHDEAFYRDLWSVITSGRTWRGRIVNRRKDGSLFEEETTISPLRDGQGNIVSFVGVKRDVTEQSILERQLRHSQRMESLGRLAGGIAHDFNNVMGQVLGAAELLKKIAEGEKLLAYVDLILQAVDRGKNITERMLSFSRDDEGRVGSVSAGELIEGLIEVGRHTFPKGVEIRRNLPAESGYVRCNSSQIQQALMNLCINSVDAMSGEGTLSLGYRPAPRVEIQKNLPNASGEYVCLTVVDSGAGMVPEVIEKIFLPFYTLKPVGKGTGLGLYIVYGIARAHGGWVEVQSEPGRGTTVSIGLPAGEKPVEKRIDEAPVAREAGDGRTILVVDDELGLLILLTEILEGEGYTVRCATDGREALKLLADGERPPDLVITDIGMPNMDGRELVQELRVTRPGLKVIVVSGYMDADEHAALRQFGVEAVLTKPFQVDAVLEMVGSVLSG